jgi:mono/diheme cytochrome c family protein
MAFDFYSAASRAAVKVVAVMTLSVAFVPQASAADAANGQRIAQRWCATCHVVAPGQQQTTGEAPPFAAIAKRPNFNADQIAYFLLAPHPMMPDMSLSRQSAQDIAAYIATLKN